MHLWHPREEDEALLAAVLHTRCSSAVRRRVRRRRRAERDGDGPRVPWGTGSFLLISGVTSHHAALLLADNYLAGCREGSRKTPCPRGL